MLKKTILFIITSIFISFMTMAHDEHQVKTKGKAPIYKMIEGKMTKVGYLPKNHHVVIKKDPHIKGKQEYKATVNYHETECGHLISSRYFQTIKKP